MRPRTSYSRMAVFALALSFLVLNSQLTFAQDTPLMRARAGVSTKTTREPAAPRVGKTTTAPAKTFTSQSETSNPAPPTSGGEEIEPLASGTFSNTTPITITDTPTPPSPASVYPSTISVSGLTGNITKVTVTVTGISHTFPDDIDMLLVGPTGAKFIFHSDVGGSTAASNVTITYDDAAASAIPDAGPLASGTFRPTNVGTAETFPAPAPAVSHPADDAAPAGTATFASKFNGTDPNGTWSLYIIDDLAGDGGSISGGWSLNITTAGVAVPAGALVISEFRVRGPNGANDEFIELYNTTNASITVDTADASSGLAVVASDGVTRCVVPAGTVIPSGGHYLCVNSVGYSLASYPAGNGTTATGNATYTTDIPDNAGIALFNTSTAANFTLANRLDAVGSTSEANTLYKEGTGYPALTPFSIDYSLYRKYSTTTGLPQDTGNNASDFIFVDTNGTSAGAGQRLGAPGPENLSSPIFKTTSQITIGVVDTLQPYSSPPNRVRDTTSDPANNSTFGTLSIRRKFTNNTGGNVTRLRFRIMDITTFPAPSGTADLRARTSSDVVVSLTAGGTTTVRGTTLEQPPSQPNGGGFNSTLSAGIITTGAPLANGASVDVQFLLGVQQTGSFRFIIIIEALP